MDVKAEAVRRLNVEIVLYRITTDIREDYIQNRLFLHYNTSFPLKVRNRIRTRFHSRCHVPVLHQTRPNHPPDAGDGSLAERDAVASEVDSAEGSASQVCADEDAFDLDGAAFELGGLEGDHDCGAVLLGCGNGC